MARYNIVGHYYHPSVNSDKLYIFGIRQTGNEFYVIAKWGRRGKKLSNQCKGTFYNVLDALTCMERLWKSRLKDNYLDIESDEYLHHMSGYKQSPLTLNSPEIVKNLETNLLIPNEPIPFEKQDVAPTSPKQEEKQEETTEESMICVDNFGMEDRFDIGIEYLVTTIKLPNGTINKDLIEAYDKMGRTGEYFRTRFTTVEQYKSDKRSS